MARYKVTQKELTDIPFEILQRAYYGSQNFPLPNDILSKLSPAETLAMFAGAYVAKQKEEFHGVDEGSPSTAAQIITQYVRDGYLHPFKVVEAMHGGTPITGVSTLEQTLASLTDEQAEIVVQKRIAPFVPSPEMERTLFNQHKFKTTPFYDPNRDGMNKRAYVKPLHALANQ